MKIIHSVIKPISFLTLCLFTFTQILSAASPTITIAPQGEQPSFLQIEIPKDIAEVEEVYEAPPSADPKLILHIQNIHGSYEAQVQIKKLLQYLHDQYGFKLIFAEGAVAKLNPDILRLFPDPERNVKVADALTKRGEMTGVEYYLIDGPKDVDAIGIEKNDLYRENYEAFQKVHTAKPEIDLFLNRFDERLETLASQIFSKDTRRVLSEWKKFEAGRREFLPFINTLSQDAKTFLGIDLESLFAQVEWPAICRLLVLQSMEKDIDLAAAEKERVRLLEFLKSKQVSPEIILAIEKLGERKITMSRLGDQEKLEDLPRYLFERLAAEAIPKGFYFHDYPQFSLWAGRIILEKELDSSALFEEVEKLFNKILDELSMTEREKNLLELYRDKILLEKLLHLELTRKESERSLYRKDWIAPAAMNKRAQALSETSFRSMPGEKIPDMLPSQAPPKYRETSGKKRKAEDSPSAGSAKNSPEDLAPVLDTAFQFYDFARKRETEFYKTIESEMSSKGIEKGILVTGGFHTEGLKEIFREKSISFSVLMPRITSEVENSSYVSAMMGDRVNMFDLATLEKYPILQNAVVLKAQGVDVFHHATGVLDEIRNFVNETNPKALAKRITQINRSLGKALGFRLVWNEKKNAVYIQVTQSKNGRALQASMMKDAESLAPESSFDMTPENLLGKNKKVFRMEVDKNTDGNFYLRPAILAAPEKAGIVLKTPKAKVVKPAKVIKRPRELARSEIRQYNNALIDGYIVNSEKWRDAWASSVETGRPAARELNPRKVLWGKHFAINPVQNYDQIEQDFLLSGPYAELYKEIRQYRESIDGYGPRPTGDPQKDRKLWVEGESVEDGKTWWYDEITVVVDVFDQESKSNVKKEVTKQILRYKGWTIDHEKGVTLVAVQIAQALGLPLKAIQDLAFAAAIHDLGKIRTDHIVLNDPGPGRLTAEQRLEIERHVEEAQKIIRENKWDIPDQIFEIMDMHHERFDGQGYPAKVPRNKQSLLARILKVADVFDALAAERPYKGAMPLEKIISILIEGKPVVTKEAGERIEKGEFDPILTDVFIGQLIVQEMELIEALRISMPKLLTTDPEKFIAELKMKIKAPEYLWKYLLPQIQEFRKSGKLPAPVLKKFLEEKFNKKYDPFIVDTMISRAGLEEESVPSAATLRTDVPTDGSEQLKGPARIKSGSLQGADTKRSEMRQAGVGTELETGAPAYTFDAAEKKLQINLGLENRLNFYVTAAGVTFNLKAYNLKVEEDRAQLLGALNRLSRFEKSNIEEFLAKYDQEIRGQLAGEENRYVLEQFDLFQKLPVQFSKTNSLEAMKKAVQGEVEPAKKEILFPQILDYVKSGDLAKLDLEPNELVALALAFGVVNPSKAQETVEKLAEKFGSAQSEAKKGKMSESVAQARRLKATESPASVMVVMDKEPSKKFIEAIAAMLISQVGVNIHIVYADSAKTQRDMDRIEKQIMEVITTTAEWKGVDQKALEKRLLFSTTNRPSYKLPRIMSSMQGQSRNEKAPTMRQDEFMGAYVVQLFIASDKSVLADMADKNGDPRVAQELGMVSPSDKQDEANQAAVYLAIQAVLSPDMVKPFGKQQGDYFVINVSKLGELVSEITKDLEEARLLAVAA